LLQAKQRKEFLAAADKALYEAKGERSGTLAR